MLLQSEGIVLQSINYGENSQISKILSKEKGLISVISSKSKRKKSKQTNYFQPLSPVRFICYVSNKSSIYRIKEIGFNTTIYTLKEEVSVNAVRFFLAEFLAKVIQEEEQNIPLYNFIESEVNAFYNGTTEVANMHISLLSKLCHQIGITPDFSEKGNYFDLIEGCVVSSKPHHTDYCDDSAKLLLQKSMNNDFSFTKKERQQLLNVLIHYYNIQLGGNLQNLKSKAVLEVVFS